MDLNHLFEYTNRLDREKLAWWLEKNRGRCHWDGLGYRVGGDERGALLRAGETPRPDGLDREGKPLWSGVDFLPNVEIWKVKGPKASSDEEHVGIYEETTVYKKIAGRRDSRGKEGRPFSPDRSSEDEDWERVSHKPASRGSFSDWMWCSACDVSFAADRRTLGETCVHCLYLVTKSWRSVMDADSPMFEDGVLTKDYDLEGNRRTGRTGFPQRRIRPGEHSDSRPRAPLALEDRTREPRTDASPKAASRRPSGESETLTEAEKRALENSAHYSFPFRLAPSQKYILTSREYERFGLESDPIFAVEIVGLSSDERKQKMLDFFEKVWRTHREDGLYGV